MCFHKKTWLQTLFWEIKSRFFYILLSFSLCFFISYQNAITLLYLFVLSYDTKGETSDFLYALKSPYSLIFKNKDFMDEDENFFKITLKKWFFSTWYSLMNFLGFDEHCNLAAFEMHKKNLTSLLSEASEQDLITLCNLFDSVKYSPIKFIFTDVEEAFSSIILVCFIFSLIAIFPHIVYAILSFLLPSFFSYQSQKYGYRIIKLFFFWLFFVIILQNQIIPRLAEFLLQFQIQSSGFNVEAETKIYSYCVWASTIFVVFHLIFFCISFFIFFIFNQKIEINNFVAQRKWCRILLLLLSAFLVPPDVFTQFLLAFFLIVCLEVLIYFFYIYKNLTKYKNEKSSI